MKTEEELVVGRNEERGASGAVASIWTMDRRVIAKERGEFRRGTRRFAN